MCEVLPPIKLATLFRCYDLHWLFDSQIACALRGYSHFSGRFFIFIGECSFAWNDLQSKLALVFMPYNTLLTLNFNSGLRTFGPWRFDNVAFIVVNEQLFLLSLLLHLEVPILAQIHSEERLNFNYGVSHFDLFLFLFFP